MRRRISPGSSAPDPAVSSIKPADFVVLIGVMNHTSAGNRRSYNGQQSQYRKPSNRLGVFRWNRSSSYLKIFWRVGAASGDSDARNCSHGKSDFRRAVFKGQPAKSVPSGPGVCGFVCRCMRVAGWVRLGCGPIGSRLCGQGRRGQPAEGKPSAEYAPG